MAAGFIWLQFTAIQHITTMATLDLVTSLQEAIWRLNSLLFNYLGALQRDAPAQPVKGEALVAVSKPYDVQVSGRH